MKLKIAKLSDIDNVLELHFKYLVDSIKEKESQSNQF